ncbi:MAG: heavy metal translocating P-type ATPase [Bacteroidales bacterium]|nr:heavy metal translocating P-type ATPase [Bacteroidales bacterium]
MKKRLVVIITAAVLLAGAVIIEKNCNLEVWQLLLVYLVPYLVAGFDTLKEAVEGIAEGDIFNENFLMTVATAGALCIGFLPNTETQFPEAVFVMLFFQIGELFEDYAQGKSRKSIAHLMDIRPDAANVIRDGKILTVSPEEVKVGETIVVTSGGKIPLDGTVTDGTSALNTAALTGESLPKDVTVGDEVISGCINLSGVLQIKTTKTFGESTVSRIIELVEHSSERKSRSEAFITRFARIYTPIVVFAALALAFLPPLISGDFAGTFPTWLGRALIFLVVSCPCALVISVPLTFFGGIGGASRQGILVKGGNYIDALSKVRTVVFDKTGTLTEGKFTVEAVHPELYGKEQILHLAAHVEHFSTHPIGAALREAFPEEATDDCQTGEYQEFAGEGISAKVGEMKVFVGNTKLMARAGVQWHECHCKGTIIHVAINGLYAGHIVINDKIKDDAAATVGNLKKMGVDRLVMLTGDKADVAGDIAAKIGIREYYAELLPAGKVAHVEDMLADDGRSGLLAFVGDGINDAPVLSRSDVGIAMGALGSDAAIEAADVVLMDDKPSKIASAIKIARHTLAIAKQNVWFAIGVKLAVLGLAAIGLATMWMAVFADVGVTVLAVLNAMRAYIAKE